jgi:hypothetical protein
MQRDCAYFYAERNDNTCPNNVVPVCAARIKSALISLPVAGNVRFRAYADITFERRNYRFWPLGDIGFCGAHFCF